MRISDWSSDVCSSDLGLPVALGDGIDLLPAGADAGEMRRRLLRGLAAHPVDRLEGALLGAAAGSVGDRHELRRESAEAAHGVATALLGQIGRASWRERVCHIV